MPQTSVPDGISEPAALTVPGKDQLVNNPTAGIWSRVHDLAPFDRAPDEGGPQQSRVRRALRWVSDRRLSAVSSHAGLVIRRGDGQSIGLGYLDRILSL